MSVSICRAKLFAPLANRLLMDPAGLCGCEACHSLPPLCVFVDNVVTIFRTSENGCPKMSVTPKDSQDRLPVTGTGAAPWGAAPENGNGNRNTRRTRLLGLENNK